MREYHKIDSIYKRGLDGKMLFGQYSRPEFEYLKDNLWTCTEKIDGTNIRVMWKKDSEDNFHFEFGGKTDNAQMVPGLISKLWEIFDDYMKFKFTERFTEETCLYGEGYGKKINNGGKYVEGTDNDYGFALFDIRIGNWWLKADDVRTIAEELVIGVVPQLGLLTLSGIEIMCANEFISRWGDFVAEGIVAKPYVDLNDRACRRIITKLKVRDFK